MDFFPSIIYQGDITEYTPDLLLNKLKSIVAHFFISIVSILGYFVNGVSDCIDLSLSFTNLIVFSALGTYKFTAHRIRNQPTFVLYVVRSCFTLILILPVAHGKRPFEIRLFSISDACHCLLLNPVRLHSVLNMLTQNKDDRC